MFKTNRASRFSAIVAVIDIENFTPFCSHPGSSTKLPEYLNFVFGLVEDSFELRQVRKPSYWKFLGDGALYVWDITDDSLRREFSKQIVLALHNLFRVFTQSVRDAADDLAASALPTRIRVAIVQGDLIKLQPNNPDQKIIVDECVGFPINLAARLQKYCPSLGFLVSTSVELDNEFIESYGFKKVRTRTIRGMRGVDVEVRYLQEDLRGMRRSEFEKWFRPITDD